MGLVMTTEEAKQLVIAAMQKQAKKAAEKKAYWEHYREQLAKGNSNVNTGAHHRFGGKAIRSWIPWGSNGPNL